MPPPPLTCRSMKPGASTVPGGITSVGPLTRALVPRRDALNHPAIDQDHRIIVPSVSIEDTVGRNRQPGCSGCSAGSRPIASLPHWPAGGPIDPRLDAPARCAGAIIAAELCDLTNVPEGCRQTVSAPSLAIFREQEDEPERFIGSRAVLHRCRWRWYQLPCPHRGCARPSLGQGAAGPATTRIGADRAMQAVRAASEAAAVDAGLSRVPLAIQ